MAERLVSDLDYDVTARLQEREVRDGPNLEAEVRKILSAVPDSIR